MAAENAPNEPGPTGLLVHARQEAAAAAYLHRQEAQAVADALLRGGADPSPPVLRPGVLRRKTNLAPESPLAIADRRGKTALVALLTAAAAATPPRPPR